ncbi:MAG: hypothetical protein NZ960_03485 [Candidatus Kapabacteria bacterium]|nr:hypothetical protein [Candidatus Kapabacteria bacterium]MDW8012280.1 hypothetical protein [Bacteroidota bacterium]
MTLLVLFAGFVMGCRSSAVDLPVEGEILVGQGGGFTGLYSGYIVRSDGLVLRWSQMPGRPEGMEELGRVAADSLQPFFRRLVVLERQGVRLQGAGNMTAFLELRTASGRYRLQWGMGEELPKAVEDLYSELLQFLRRRLP